MAFDFTQTFPGGASNPNFEDTLRINIRALEVLSQNLNPKLANHIETGDEQYSWSMVAPSDIQENISHTWEEYSSIQGRMAGIRADFMKSGSKIYALKGGATTEGGNTNAGLVKVDAPLVYSGSERRQYSFTFPMMEHENLANDVAGPINQFRLLSCASTADAAYDTIRFPSVFEIRSWPNPFIFIKWAALMDVQVVYQAPFKRGLPMRGELTLTFKDLKPLYKSSWDASIEDKVTIEGERRAMGYGRG